MRFARSSRISRPIVQRKCLDVFLTASATTGPCAKRCSSAPRCRSALRARIAVAAAKDLGVEASPWMAPERAERVAREARDQAICTIASLCRPGERAELTRALRAAGALTPAL